jgi:hypothetical protein
MLVQIISGRVADADLLRRQSERWVAEIKPGAKGYLGSTGGVTPDGRGITIARFESKKAAEQNSKRADQSAWWNETEKAFEGAVTFSDCEQIDTIHGGGSNDAGFVQVIQGRAKDAKKMRSQLPKMEADLRKNRPDLVGALVAWHDDGGFTQVTYFTSEAETRKYEKATEDDELRAQYMDLIDGRPTFFDLPQPELD